MKATLIALLFAFVALAQKSLPKFMGREVTVTEPPLDSTGFYPTAPATVCVEGPPEKQCYVAPEGYGRSPEVEVVQIERNTPALFFSVESGGVSGSSIHFALLRPGGGKNLGDIFLSETTVSNLSQHAFWTDRTISDSPIFVTEDFVWGPDEAHYSPHRYIVSSYVLKHPKELDGVFYYLEDRYMTTRTYNLDTAPPPDILAAEKPEILARLRRVKAANR